MTKNELLDERRRALNLLTAYEAGNMVTLDENDASDFTNDHTEAQICGVARTDRRTRTSDRRSSRARNEFIVLARLLSRTPHM
jgi:hypothetical protein